MAVTHLDGRAFEKFIAAGTYFLRKYRGVLNDLNVFPVPDGDTGSNMFLTLRSAVEADHFGDRTAHLFFGVRTARDLFLLDELAFDR